MRYHSLLFRKPWLFKRHFSMSPDILFLPVIPEDRVFSSCDTTSTTWQSKMLLVCGLRKKGGGMREMAEAIDNDTVLANGQHVFLTAPWQDIFFYGPHHFRTGVDVLLTKAAIKITTKGDSWCKKWSVNSNMNNAKSNLSNILKGISFSWLSRILLLLVLY